MIQWVYERAAQAALLQKIIIATDDDRIFHACSSFGAEVCMTSPGHRSGTDRIAEAAKAVSSPVIVNIQGDEPLIRGDMLDSLVEALQDESSFMATLAASNEDLSLQNDPNIVKVVIDSQGSALYFSRAAIPFHASDHFLQHIGIYAYHRNFLLDFCRWPPSRLEETERLEQLRILERGHRIKVVLTPHSTLSVDTPEDIIKVEEILMKGRHA